MPAGVAAGWIQGGVGPDAVYWAGGPTLWSGSTAVQRCTRPQLPALHGSMAGGFPTRTPPPTRLHPPPCSCNDWDNISLPGSLEPGTCFLWNIPDLQVQLVSDSPDTPWVSGYPTSD